MDKIRFSKFRSLRSPLMKKVILASFIPTIVVFTLFTLNQFRETYFQRKEEINIQVKALEFAVHTQLESAIWEVNKPAVDQIMKVLAGNPHIAWVKLEGQGLNVFEEKKGIPNDWETLEFNLFKVQSKQKLHIGVLKIALTKSRFTSEFMQLFYYSLIENLFIFVALATCLTILINKKIIEPVRKINELTFSFNEEHIQPIIGESLISKNRIHKTEIENLHAEILLLQNNFKKALEVQKELETEKQKLALSQRLETIGQMTSQVAHDFGNILMIMNNKINLLMKSQMDENQRRHLESIKNASGRATSLVRKILYLTKMQRSEVKIIDPFQMILEMQDLLKISIGSQVELHISHDGDENFIQTEVSNFENAVINLCVNARDAMPEGGRISINVSKVNSGAEDLAVVSIADTGTGIPEEIREKIFDPFFTTKPVDKGTGLGLAQVNKFVKDAGGKMELQSGPEGTCFKMMFPLKAASVIKAA